MVIESSVDAVRGQNTTVVATGVEGTVTATSASQYVSNIVITPGDEGVVNITFTVASNTGGANSATLVVVDTVESVPVSTKTVSVQFKTFATTLVGETVFDRQQELAGNQGVLLDALKSVKTLVIVNLAASIASLGANIATIITMLNTIEDQIDDIPEAIQDLQPEIVV